MFFSLTCDWISYVVKDYLQVLIPLPLLSKG